jgi:hypothetical protein
LDRFALRCDETAIHPGAPRARIAALLASPVPFRRLTERIPHIVLSAVDHEDDKGVSNVFRAHFSRFSYRSKAH